MNETVTQIRTHQAVVFEKKQQNYFSITPTTGRTTVNIEFMPEIQAVIIHTEEDRALIPFVNIAYMKLETLEQKPVAKKSSK